MHLLAPALAKLPPTSPQTCLPLSPTAAAHHHWDHVGGNEALKQQFGCTIVGPAADAARIPGIDVALKDGDRRALGKDECLLHCCITAAVRLPFGGHVHCTHPASRQAFPLHLPLRLPLHLRAGTSWARIFSSALKRRATRGATAPCTSRPPRRSSQVGGAAQAGGAKPLHAAGNFAESNSTAAPTSRLMCRRHALQPGLRPPV